LLRAFGFLPVEVWGPPRTGGECGRLQGYICSIARNSLAFLQEGGLDATDLLVVPHTCDSLQGVGTLLRDLARPRQEVATFYLPRGRRSCDLEFLAAEFRALFETLRRITGGNPSEGELLECVLREEEADSRLAELSDARARLPFSDKELYRLLRSREYLPAEVFAREAMRALALPAGEPRGGKPVVLSGIVPEPFSFLAEMNALGAWVAADDLACCGRRLYPAGKSRDPWLRMAERQIGAPPDSTLGDSTRDRLEHILRLVRKSGARGVVFHGVKFCEPELFYLPDLRRGLQEAGVRSLHLEFEIGDSPSQQALNRLEVFLEML
jgi:benzoyl-CoA reductase/2-hydroxyglutaryl-CoA dehydratase subunit BcrC/BadD/HgdB